VRLVSLNIGHPAVLVRHGRQYSSAINRRPVAGALMLRTEGLDGDRVSDDRVHGGPDKAVCCYPHEHYEYFANRLGRAITAPAFGENFTTAGLLEEAVCIGDAFRIGGARVQVTQPRQPCAKLALKHDTPELIHWVNETAFTGFYFRVVEAGAVHPADAFELLDRPRPGLTVAAATRARLAQPTDHVGLEALLRAPELSAAWRREISRRLHGDAAAGDD
jgi:MOSC domain-containing protein YiiM